MVGAMVFGDGKRVVCGWMKLEISWLGRYYVGRRMRRYGWKRGLRPPPEWIWTFRDRKACILVGRQKGKKTIWEGDLFKSTQVQDTVSFHCRKWQKTILHFDFICSWRFPKCFTMDTEALESLLKLCRTSRDSEWISEDSSQLKLTTEGKRS